MTPTPLVWECYCSPQPPKLDFFISAGPGRRAAALMKVMHLDLCKRVWPAAANLSIPQPQALNSVFQLSPIQASEGSKSLFRLLFSGGKPSLHESAAMTPRCLKRTSTFAIAVTSLTTGSTLD